MATVHILKLHPLCFYFRAPQGQQVRLANLDFSVSKDPQGAVVNQEIVGNKANLDDLGIPGHLVTMVTMVEMEMWDSQESLGAKAPQDHEEVL